MSIKTYRPFITAVVTLSFIVVTITGLLMAFHLLPKDISHILKGLHEWLSYLFVLGAGFHLYYNWKAITGYFNNKSIRYQWLIAGGLCVLLSLGVFLLKPEKDHHKKFNEMQLNNSLSISE